MSESFTLTLECGIREARRDDLPDLEWFGMFTEHREIIADAFRRHRAGENLMLVAEVNGFPAGQAWVDLERRKADDTGLLWAVRVFPAFQRLGLGGRLLAAAEDALAGRGYAWAEIGVEKDNPDALRLYHRVGYRTAGELREAYEFTPPGGEAPLRVALDQWILRKRLPPRT